MSVKRNSSRLKVALVSFSTLILGIASSSVLAAPARQVPNVMVLIADSDATKTSAEQVVSRVNSMDASWETLDTKARLGFPARARFVLPQRKPIADRANLPANDPLAILHRWVVLEYARPALANLAYETISSSDKFVMQKLRDSRVLPQALPTDPAWASWALSPNVPVHNPSTYGGVTSVPGTTQKAAHKLLNLPNAWDSIHGSAYVGIVDYGVAKSHEDLVGNLRLHFSRNYSPDSYFPGYVPGNVTGFADLGQQDFDDLIWLDMPVGLVRLAIHGHGTHIAGIVAAQSNNSFGGAGVCWKCSISAARVDRKSESVMSVIPAAFVGMVDVGNQIINFSTAFPEELGYGFLPKCTNAGMIYHPMCAAIAYAKQRGVTIVASSGNKPERPTTGFPASDTDVWSVGATTSTGATATFSAGGKVDFIAPGERIFSTLVDGKLWGAEQYVPGGHCQSYLWNGSLDYSPPLTGTTAGGGYGYCTGTSMSAPMISGAVALVRSANPLLSDASTKTLLRQYASNATAAQACLSGEQTPDCAQNGFGLPNVCNSVYAALWDSPTGNKGLTPLFAMHNSTAKDHFATVVPQMARAASCGTLRVGYNTYGPVPSGAYEYLSTSAVPNVTQLPGMVPASCAANQPSAIAKVSSTPVRYEIDRSQPLQSPPILKQVQMEPLYRMSRASTTYVVENIIWEHLYAVGDADMAFYKSHGFVLDGVEGYVYPYDASQPSQGQKPGTLKLHRRWLSERRADVSAIFTENQAGYFATQGYTNIYYGKDVIGYVCPMAPPSPAVSGDVCFPSPEIVPANTCSAVVP